MTATALTATDRTPTTTGLTARNVFNIWLADQSELTQTVYKAEVKAFPEWAGKPAQDVHIGDIVGYKQTLGDRGLGGSAL